MLYGIGGVAPDLIIGENRGPSPLCRSDFVSQGSSLMIAATRLQVSFITLIAVFLAACTSLGHQDRTTPKIAKPIEQISEIGFDGDDEELSVAMEAYVSSVGIRPKILSAPQVRVQRGDKEYTYDEVQTRYVLRVRSIDLDTCLPEGSRQMHFSVSVTDFQERSRVFLMNGNYGCRDTLVRKFGEWFQQGSPSKKK